MLLWGGGGILVLNLFQLIFETQASFLMAEVFQGGDEYIDGVNFVKLTLVTIKCPTISKEG